MSTKFCINCIQITVNKILHHRVQMLLLSDKSAEVHSDIVECFVVLTFGNKIFRNKPDLEK